MNYYMNKIQDKISDLFCGVFIFIGLIIVGCFVIIFAFKEFIECIFGDNK